MKIELTILLVSFTFLVSNSLARKLRSTEWKCNPSTWWEFLIRGNLFLHHTLLDSLSPEHDDGPCGHWRPGDLDLGTWDMLDIFRLDRLESHHLRSISQIEGSNAYQTAFRLEQSSNLTMRADEAFPRGTPFEFSFECTYRELQKQQDSWHLFHLTNSHEESQLSVTLDPARETLQVTLPDARGGLQHAEFRHSAVSEMISCFYSFHFMSRFNFPNPIIFCFGQLFDQRWHKIMLGVTERSAKLWVDCRPVKSSTGDMESQLRQRRQYNTQNGQLSIAQLSNNRRRSSYSPPVRLHIDT